MSLALRRWNLEQASASLVAARENLVYRVRHNGIDHALRLHRVGYRSNQELVSELDWMAALAARGLSLARPLAGLDGSLLQVVEGTTVDLLNWLDGEPMGVDGKLSALNDPAACYRALGREMARLHTCSDDWQAPATFRRPAWDLDGLTGENPLWGRYWENPALSAGQSALFQTVRGRCRAAIEQSEDSLDYGLIHADLVPENVLIAGSELQFIDFDDGGAGYRLFELATALNRAWRGDSYEQHRDALLQGYLQTRPLDIRLLPVFQVLRALSYVGWIIPRLDEPGGQARNERFIAEALTWCDALES